MVKSRADELLEQRNVLPPEITPHMAYDVSDFRRSTLEQELNSGRFREKGSVPQHLRQGQKDSFELGYVKIASASKKTASGSPVGGIGLSSGSGGSGGWRGSGGTVRQMPEVYSPLWLNSNLNLPRDRATVNAWCRSFFALNPIVQNSISLHSTYPLAKLNIKCKNRKVENFFQAMCDEIDLMNVCVDIAQEFWTLGEAFIYAELDDRTAKWSRLSIQNPDYISVKRSVIAGEPIISLRPDENLRRVVMSQNPADIQQRQQLDPAIIEHVRRGENIPLNNFYVSHLARRISPYEVRGTGLIVSCFRQLMLFDQLRESKYVQAGSMINPLTLIKIGNQEFRPTPADLEAWRSVFEEATLDKDFKVITHDAVDVQRVGYGQGIYDISGDITQLIKEIYIGLMVPAVLMDGQDTTYANGSVALDVLRQRYVQFRNKISTWLRTKIFAPISMLNDFYEYEEGEKRLIVPEVDWNHMSLFDMSDYIGHIMGLTQGEDKKVSVQTLYRSLGLDYQDELRKIRYENIQETILNKEKESLQKLNLNALRALGPDDEIVETKEGLLPGEEEPETEGEPDMFGPDFDLPGAPPSAPVGMGLPPSPGGGTGIGPGGIPEPTPPT